MIVGTTHWNNRDCYYRQENNPTEQMLKKRLPGGKGWLETCGSTASTNCRASLDGPIVITAPGGYSIQPEETVTDCFNDPVNYPAFRQAYNGIDPESVPGNEVAQWYPVACQLVFGKKATFAGKLSYDNVCTHLRSGNPVQVCLINPGHFVAIVAFDDVTGEFIFHDSWTGRWPDGDGFCKRMTRQEFETNTKPVCIVYW